MTTTTITTLTSPTTTKSITKPSYLQYIMQFAALLGLLLFGEGFLARRIKQAKDNQLTIIHTNDIHAHYDQTNNYGGDCTPDQINKKQCYGGLARIQTKVTEIRKKYKRSLLFDAGDQFQGTMFYTYSKGNVTWEAMNLLKYDLMTVGNHEFDHGPENLGRVASHFNFPLVSSNIDASQHPTLKNIIKRYHLFPEHKLAVVGYITYNAPAICNLGDKIKILDPVVAVQSAIDEVKKLGYKRVVAVSHNGYKEDQELAKQLKGLSLIVGGHSHTYLAPSSGPVKDSPTSEGLYPTSVINRDNQPTYIVQAYWMSRFLGHIDIEFKPDGYLSSIIGRPIDLNSDVVMDTKVQAQVDAWRKPFDAFSKQVLGQSTGEFDRWGCFNSECNLGNFVTDIMLNYRPKAEIAIINSGDLRTSLPKGPITVGDVMTALPYGSTVVQIPLTGKQIWSTIESVLSRNSTFNHQPVTSFIQISGLQITYNPDAPLHRKLQSCQVLHQPTKKLSPLDPNRTYQVATFDFLAKGGDNVITPPPSQGLSPLEAIDAVTMEFIRTHSPVSPPPLGRMIKKSSLKI